jgi:hypothetical protein
MNWKAALKQILISVLPDLKTQPQNPEIMATSFLSFSPRF